MQMENICALVTGGASGLGEAAARRILDRGGRVCIVDMDEEKGTNIQKELGGRLPTRSIWPLRNWVSLMCASIVRELLLLKRCLAKKGCTNSIYFPKSYQLT